MPSSLPGPSLPCPTWIVVHPRENRKKCSVEPLRGRADFHFVTFRAQAPVLPEAGRYFRLGLGGELLSPADARHGLLVLDGTWRLAQPMEAAYASFPVRSLGPWQTAYPRISKVFDDPSGGLATIEAIFAAYVALGYDTTGLLDHYHWRDAFLELNRSLLPPER
ncbi:MAG: hypothetical protein U0903_00945 [Planctomycetales bacterium]